MMDSSNVLIAFILVEFCLLDARRPRRAIFATKLQFLIKKGEPGFEKVSNFADMTPEERLKIEEKIVSVLRTVYDPEIPVDIYSLGLVYKVDLADSGDLSVDMTLTAPNCPMADFIMEDVRTKLEGIEGVKSVTVNIVFEPEWTQDMMSEEAKLELGLL